MLMVLMPEDSQIITVAATGASGAVFTRALLQIAERDTRIQTVNFIASDNALRVFAEELGIKGRTDLAAQLLGSQLPGSKPFGSKSSKIQQQNNDDIGGNVASGSYPATAMIILPCSMGTLARIANGLASSLIDRAADVCLKEKRPLVLCTRETPLNRIHIRNMDLAASAGASIYPLIPTFYNRPTSIDEMAHQFACRVLAFIGLSQPDAFQWKGQI